MGFFSILGKGLRALLGKPKSFTVGEKFEHYARQYLFSKSYYELLQKTHGYKTRNKNYVPSADPDFKFRDRRNGKIFFVEAKYRSSFFNGQVSWCTENQLRRYQQRNRECPVFILLGIGGSPDRPAFVSLIPLSQANFTALFRSHAEKYAIHPKKIVSPKILWKR
jgi:hypothetical protein